jgi:hypothetical protein
MRLVGFGIFEGDSGFVSSWSSPDMVNWEEWADWDSWRDFDDNFGLIINNLKKRERWCI